MDVAANRHHFAHGLHRRVQQWLGALELFKGKARNFGDDIINRRFERCWRCAGNVIGDFVERETDRQFRRDLRNREARGFRCKRRRTRYARVHFNHDQAAILRIDCELYVGTTCFYADFTQARDARIAHDLIFFVGQRQRWRNRDGIAGVHAHRVDILNRADDDGIVRAVTHDFHLIFFPTEQRFFNQHFGGWRCIKAAGHDLDKFVAVVSDTAAGATHGETWANDRWQARALKHLQRFFHRMRDARPRRFQTNFGHRVAKLNPVLSLVDRFGIRANHLNAIFCQRAVVEQSQSNVQRSLPTHRRQHRVGALFFNDLGDDFGRDRLDIGRVGHIRISHDRRGIGIDEDDAIALFAQRLARLRPRIIKLARLPDNDGARADDED